MAPNGTSAVDHTRSVCTPERKTKCPVTSSSETDGKDRPIQSFTTSSHHQTPSSTPSSSAPPSLNYRKESDRRKTFIPNWPLSFLHPNDLAAAGFYYLNKADLVRCIFCNIEIGKWEVGDDPMRDHQRWKPNCPFVKSQDVGNIPFGQEEDSTTSTNQGYDTCGPYGIEVRPNSGPERGENHSLEKFGIHKSTGPMYKEYRTYDARFRSYSLWPVSLKQKPDVLSEAGFFYTGKGDQTVCYHCGGGLKDWEDSDDPWEEHALWFSKCTHVLLVKGKEFVKNVCAEKEAKLTNKEAQTMVASTSQSSLVETRQPQEEETSRPATANPTMAVEGEKQNNLGKPDEARLCKICFIEDLGVLFLPCGHIVACVHCAPALSVCAVCRQPFTATVRAYLP